MAQSQSFRGSTHELFVAEEIINNSDGKAHFATSNTQTHVYNMRKDSIEKISEQDIPKIRKVAQITADLLPKAVGEVLFTEKSANGGYVYDVLYSDKKGDPVYLSCKLSNIEDKAYRFNTLEYNIDNCNNYLKSIFNQEKVDRGLSFAEALIEENLKVSDIQKALISEIESSILSDETNQTFEMIMKLIDERFIGHGGYYKTLANGSIIYYPENKATNTFVIDKSTVEKKRHTTIVFDVDMYDENNNFIQKYALSFRVKFKDGVNKPIKLNSEDTPSNIAATVGLKLK